MRGGAVPSGRGRTGHVGSRRELRAVIEEGDGRVERILELARTHLDMDVAFVGRLDDDQRVIEAAVDRAGGDGGLTGQRDALSASYCHLVVSGAIEAIVPDAARHPRLAEMPVTSDRDIHAHVGVPIRGADGAIHGTLCCFAHEPRGDLGAADEAVMRLLAELIAERIEETALMDLEQQVTRDQLRRMMHGDRVGTVFQPIVELTSGRILGYEALSRFDSEVDAGPDRWFAEAYRVGVGAELEAHALRLALAYLEEIPARQFLSVNVSASGLASPEVLAALRDVPADRVVVELTEHHRGELDRLEEVLRQLRAAGVRVAMDDMGAGYAGLRRVLRLKPELIKLDREVVTAIHVDRARRALVEAVVGFAACVGALLVAEGVELADEASVLTILGVRAGQGYHYGVPRRRPWRALPARPSGVTAAPAAE